MALWKGSSTSGVPLSTQRFDTAVLAEGDQQPKERKRFQAVNRISEFKCLILSPCGFCNQTV